MAGEIQSTRTGLWREWDFASTPWDVLNDVNLKLLGYIMHPSVINFTTATPPGSPSLGDTYAIAASPTGAWSARTEGDLAIWVSHTPDAGRPAFTDTWYFITPYVGLTVHSQSPANQMRVWNGTNWEFGWNLTDLVP